MGYTTSTVHGIEVPDSSEANDVPEDIGKVVTALEGGSIIRRLTGAAIAALTAPEKPAGLVVYNTTTGTMEISNGTDFVEVAAPTWQAWPTTTITQGATPTQSVTARYTRSGDLVIAHFYATFSAGTGGTAGQPVEVTLPVNAAVAGVALGSWAHIDAGNPRYTGTAYASSASTARFWRSGVSNAHGIDGTITLSVDDTFSCMLTYEAA